MKTFKLDINYSQPPVDLGCLSMYFFYSFLGLGVGGGRKGCITHKCVLYTGDFAVYGFIITI